MNNSRVAEVALDFSSREREREYEFSIIWKGRLDAVFADVAPYYDFASNLASLGLCNWWRRRFLSFIEVAPGDSVLDVCAGTNGVGIGLLRRQPDLRVFALDRSAAMQAGRWRKCPRTGISYRIDHKRCPQTALSRQLF